MPAGALHEPLLCSYLDCLECLWRQKALQETENEANRLTQEIVEASRTGGGPRIGEMSKTVHQLRKMIDAYLEELEPVLQEHDRQKEEFDKRLAELDAKENGL